jgi:DNA modification methylase
LDPFSGSGTTCLESALWGWEAFGLEVNPFMATIARAKTHEYKSASKVEAAYSKVIIHKERVCRIPRDSTLVERKGLKQWLFNRSVAFRFEQIRSGIEQCSDKKIQDLLNTCLISSMEDVSNAKRDGKCWRYLRGWEFRNYKDSDLDAAFHQQFTSILEDIKATRLLHGKATIIEGDSRKLKSFFSKDFSNTFDAVITSPPYPNSFDYTDIYRPNTILLGAAKSASDLRQLRLRTIRSHVQVDWPAPNSVPTSTVARLIKKLRGEQLWNKRLATMVHAYFEDLDQVSRDCYSMLREGGTMHWVVGRSAYSGVVINVDRILASIFEANGFTNVTCTELRRISGNGQHRRISDVELAEVLVSCQKPSGGSVVQTVPQR